MSTSLLSRVHLRTLLKLPLERTGISTGRWGDIIEGHGWHEVEFAGRQAFRWAGSDAAIKLAPLASTWLCLDLDLEPGPSLAGAPLHLEVHDDSGQCVARVEAAGRQVAHIVVPVHPVMHTTLMLKVVGPTYPVPADPRCLCYRAFSIGQSGPLLSPRMRFESGWHAYEKAGRAAFRWASNGASIQVHAARANPVLTADLEPGPGTQQRPFRIDVSAPDGERIFTTSIRRREQIQIRLPMQLGEFATFQFLADESMVVRAPRDSRDLVFRTFGMTVG